MKSLISVMVLVMWLGLSSGVVNALSPGSIDSDFVNNTTSFNAIFGNS